MMETSEKIKKLRELNDLTQSDMAEKLEMSLSGYAKIERGISQPNVAMLERIAKVLGITVNELLSFNGKNLISIICDNSNDGDNNNNVYYGDNHTELEKAHLVIQHKNELLAQKDAEIAALKRVIALLEKGGAN